MSDEDLALALKTLAHILTLPEGQLYVALFEKLESALAERCRASAAVERAKHLLEGTDQRCARQLAALPSAWPAPLD